MPKPQSPKSSRSRWTEKEAFAVLEAQRASGLSVQNFARREGLVAERLYRWRRAVERAGGSKSKGPVFVEVTPPVREHIEVVLRGGRVLRFPARVDIAVLPRIADALEAAPEC